MTDKLPPHEDPDNFYYDPDPPKWPNTRTPFNRWYRKLHDFLYALQTQFYWGRHSLFGKVKYLNIRVDTRNGNFLVFRESDTKDGEPVQINPDELGLEYRPLPFTVEMQPMVDAPKDRPILVKVNDSKWVQDNNSFIIAKYYKDSQSKRGCWLSSESSFDLEDPDFLGWWDLPQVKQGP